MGGKMTISILSPPHECSIELQRPQRAQLYLLQIVRKFVTGVSRDTQIQPNGREQRILQEMVCCLKCFWYSVQI